MQISRAEQIDTDCVKLVLAVSAEAHGPAEKN